MKRLLILCVCLLTISSLHAQETYRSSGKPKYNAHKKKNDERFIDRLIFGGGITLGFGDYTNIGITPVVGYRITDNFSAGVGLGYQYVRIKDYFQVEDPNTFITQNYDLKASLFSASVWARYIVWRNFFVQGEFEQNYMNFKTPGYDQSGSGNIVERTTKYQAPCILVGVGYRQPLGDHASVNFSIHYDVLQAEYSPYGNQLFPRIQFLLGL